ncbi:MAG TPA: ECF-type sigma factor [Gemmatimonadales bacterium]|nr:ECF-type sigma factor [Gemmatimonadales bacterium]
MQTNLPDLLSRAEQADSSAADELFALLYGELRRLAEHTCNVTVAG